VVARWGAEQAKMPNPFPNALFSCKGGTSVT
jgi:hypothetical protein